MMPETGTLAEVCFAIGGTADSRVADFLMVDSWMVAVMNEYLSVWKRIWARRIQPLAKTVKAEPVGALSIVATVATWGDETSQVQREPPGKRDLVIRSTSTTEAAGGAEEYHLDVTLPNNSGER